MQSLAIPTDDGTLEEALNDLDKVMDAWMGAVRDLHGEAVSTESTPPPPNVVEEQVAQVESASSPPDDLPSSPPAEEPQSQQTTLPQETQPAPPSKSTPAQTSWRGTIEALSKASEPGISSPAEPPVATPVAAPPIVSEDEALLASLDPKTAEAVRVMRRLSPGKKSVRELLDEYRAGNTVTVEPTTKKSSWWKRK